LRIESDVGFPVKEIKDWEVVVHDCEQQTNHSDCGVYLCININTLEMCGKPAFTKKENSNPSKSTRMKREHIKKALLRGFLKDDEDLGMILTP
jgi:Ulp1 family protease